MTLPHSLSREEAREYDARAIAAGIPGIVLMENAARGATELLLSLGVTGSVSIVCGKGNNAGDGFVMARLLHAAGKSAIVELVSDPADLKGDALLAYQLLATLGIPIHRVDLNDLGGFLSRLRRSEWLVDALLGTGAEGPVRSPFDQVIEVMNSSGRPIFAVDLPSGLDADTGRPLGPTIKAAVTATFVARKKGFDEPGSEQFTGPVHVISLGVSERN